MKSATPTEKEYTLPPSLLAASGPILVAFQDIVERTSQFSKEVGDVVRGDPKVLEAIVHNFAQITTVVFRRWNVEILYLLSVENRLRFSAIKEFVPGITGRSLSLKLDEMEQLGLLHREVSNDKPPQVFYSLTDAGRMLTRLSFPMVLQLNLDRGLRAKLAAAVLPPDQSEIPESD